MSNVLAIARFYRAFRKKKPMLYMFLKEHKALKKFSINCRFNIRYCSSIGEAFLWCNTKEGQHYWAQLSIKYALYEAALLNEL